MLAQNFRTGVHLMMSVRRLFHQPLMVSREHAQVIFIRILHSFALLNLRAFVITDTELKLIAAAAMMGESSKPKNG